MMTQVYMLFGSVKHDPYDDHVVGVFSSVEKAVQRAQALVAQDEYDAFRVIEQVLDSDAEGQLVRMLPVGHMYHVQVTVQDHTLPVSVVVRNQEEAFSQAKQWVVDHYAEKGVRVFKKHMQASIVFCDLVPVLIEC